MRQNINIKEEEKENNKQTSLLPVAAIGGGVAINTASKTKRFDNECNIYRERLGAKATENQLALDTKLRENPGFVGYRSKGVELSYEYEVADVKMGGRGAANWSRPERLELLKTGRVRGSEGHHTNNVANHPELQTNPDNITHYKNRKEHLEKGHGGDFRNESSGPLVSKDDMLRKTNNRRVTKNEIKGVSFSVLGGAIYGMGMSVVNTWKEDGISYESTKKGIKKSGKLVVKYSATALLAYSVFRSSK